MVEEKQKVIAACRKLTKADQSTRSAFALLMLDAIPPEHKTPIIMAAERAAVAQRYEYALAVDLGRQYSAERDKGFAGWKMSNALVIAYNAVNLLPHDYDNTYEGLGRVMFEAAGSFTNENRLLAKAILILG